MIAREDVDSCTFNQYWSLATMGFSDRNVKSLLFQVKGIGTIRLIKSPISNTKRAKT